MIQENILRICESQGSRTLPANQKNKVNSDKSTIEKTISVATDSLYNALNCLPAIDRRSLVVSAVLLSALTVAAGSCEDTCRSNTSPNIGLFIFGLFSLRVVGPFAIPLIIASMSNGRENDLQSCLQRC